MDITGQNSLVHATTPGGGGGHIDPLGPCYHKFKEFLNRFEAIIGGRRIKKRHASSPSVNRRALPSADVETPALGD